MVLLHANFSLTIPVHRSQTGPGTSPCRHCGEVHAVLEADLNNMDRGAPCIWSWDQWVVLGTQNSCSLCSQHSSHWLQLHLEVDQCSLY